MTTGIADKAIGTVSNNSSEFSLVIDATINANDSISFSILGYQTKIAIAQLHLPNNSIELEPQDNL